VSPRSSSWSHAQSPNFAGHGGVPHRGDVQRALAARAAGALAEDAVQVWGDSVPRGMQGSYGTVHFIFVRLAARAKQP